MGDGREHLPTPRTRLAHASHTLTHASHTHSHTHALALTHSHTRTHTCLATHSHTRALTQSHVHILAHTSRMHVLGRAQVSAPLERGAQSHPDPPSGPPGESPRRQGYREGSPPEQGRWLRSSRLLCLSSKVPTVGAECVRGDRVISPAPMPASRDAGEGPEPQPRSCWQQERCPGLKAEGCWQTLRALKVFKN